MKFSFRKNSRSDNSEKSESHSGSEKTISQMARNLKIPKNEDDIASMSLIDQIYPESSIPTAPQPAAKTPQKPPEIVDPYQMVLKEKDAPVARKIKQSISNRLKRESTGAEKKTAAVIAAVLLTGTMIGVIIGLFALFNSLKLNSGPPAESNMKLIPKTR